jgi:hypothetical protein
VVFGFAELLQLGGSTHWALAVYTLQESLSDATDLLSLLRSSLSVAWVRLPTVDVPFPLLSRTVALPQLHQLSIN